jgi:hypothetical protein
MASGITVIDKIRTLRHTIRNWPMSKELVS